MRPHRCLVALAATAILFACSSASDATESFDARAQEVRAASSRKAKSSEFLDVELAFPAGVAGGKDLIFVGSPFEGRVVAYSRATRRLVGELPVPQQGYILPFIVKHLGNGRVAVLDAGGFPSPEPLIPANPSINEYEYSYHPGTGLSARLVRRIGFEGTVVGFAEDAIRLDDGRWLLSDAVLGNIWVAETDGTIRPGVTRRSLDPTDAIPQMVYCSGMPLIEVGGIPFLFTDSTLPGVSSLAARFGTLYFYSPCAAGLFSLPLSVLTDQRAPYERARDIRMVSPQPPDIAVEQLLGITFNPFLPYDRYLYAADSLQLRVIQIDVISGVRRTIADSPRLFDFPSSMGFMPPDSSDSIAPLLVLSNQQHRTVITNDAIQSDQLALPFFVTKVEVAPTCGRH